MSRCSDVRVLALPHGTLARRDAPEPRHLREEAGPVRCGQELFAFLPLGVNLAEHPAFQEELAVLPRLLVAQVGGIEDLCL